MSDKIVQKSIEQYFSELQVSEEKKEKCLMAVTELVYERNQNVIAWEKSTDPEEKVKLLAKAEDKDKLIRKKIADILAGKVDEVHYDF